MAVWRYGYREVWRYEVWRQGGVAVLRYGDREVAVWRYGGMAVLRYRGMEARRCGGMRYGDTEGLRYRDRERRAVCEGAVRHDPDPREIAICAQLRLGQQGVHLGLQHLRRHAAARQGLPQVPACPVGD